MSTPAVKGVANALRSFLRFGELRGEVPSGLAAGVPSSPPGRPRTDPQGDRRRARAARRRRLRPLDRGRPPRSCRAAALARLGLRACEVIRLALDDIDYDHATARSRQGWTAEPAAVAADVGAAIAAYLQNGRPLRGPAPLPSLTGADPRSARRIRRRRCDRALRTRAGQGRRAAPWIAPVPACLGRSHVAARRVAAEIGEVLRHRSPQSTSIYAKVDLAALRTLAVAWPGGAR